MDNLIYEDPYCENCIHGTVDYFMLCDVKKIIQMASDHPNAIVKPMCMSATIGCEMRRNVDGKHCKYYTHRVYDENLYKHWEGDQ